LAARKQKAKPREVAVSDVLLPDCSRFTGKPEVTFFTFRRNPTTLSRSRLVGSGATTGREGASTKVKNHQKSAPQVILSAGETFVF
jgi:hypothetical protein